MYFFLLLSLFINLSLSSFSSRKKNKMSWICSLLVLIPCVELSFRAHKFLRFLSCASGPMQMRSQALWRMWVPQVSVSSSCSQEILRAASSVFDATNTQLDVSQAEGLSDWDEHSGSVISPASVGNGIEIGSSIGGRCGRQPITLSGKSADIVNVNYTTNWL